MVAFRQPRVAAAFSLLPGNAGWMREGHLSHLTWPHPILLRDFDLPESLGLDLRPEALSLWRLMSTSFPFVQAVLRCL